VSKEISKCLNETDYSGFKRNEWPTQNNSSMSVGAQCAKAATMQSAQQEIEKGAGIRYSELLRLPYFDIVRCHLVDPMHNLFLGTAKKVLKLWRDRKLLTERKFEEIQELMDEINPPADIGRIPN